MARFEGLVPHALDRMDSSRLHRQMRPRAEAISQGNIWRIQK